jgi:predicted dithiol-disulfide oxidoreductase (DUF899 family)
MSNESTTTPIQDEMRNVYEALEAGRRRLAELRRQLPPEPVRDYDLVRSDGTPVRLYELFGDQDDLIVVHNMGRGCAYCTLWADGFSGVYDHLASRAAFVVSSPDRPEVQQAFADERGWSFPIVSTAGSAFTRDMGFIEGEGDYWPGVSAFRRHPDGSVTRVAKDYFGPGDVYCGVYHVFDLLQDGAGDWAPRFTYR